jgi:hypothetical protein
MFRFLRKKCPRCPAGRLRHINGVVATRVDEQGKRFPDSWNYYGCDRCEARLKLSACGTFGDATDGEWERHCSGR